MPFYTQGRAMLQIFLRQFYHCSCALSQTHYDYIMAWLHPPIYPMPYQYHLFFYPIYIHQPIAIYFTIFRHDVTHLYPFSLTHSRYVHCPLSAFLHCHYRPRPTPPSSTGHYFSHSCALPCLVLMSPMLLGPCISKAYVFFSILYIYIFLYAFVPTTH